MQDPEEGRPCLPKYWSKDKNIPDCEISLASFVLYFHLLLIRYFVRIRSFFFVSWSLVKKLNFKQVIVPGGGGGAGCTPIMAYTGRLRPKGIFFQASGILV